MVVFYLTTGHFCLCKAFITVWFRFKCAWTSSGGVKAIDWFSETSAKRALLNSSRKRNSVPHRLIDPTPQAHSSQVPAWLPHDDGLVLAQGGHRLRVQVQVCLHQLGRRQRHPLVQ
jgi:hypothetical protein